MTGVIAGPLEDQNESDDFIKALFQNMESSYEGHTVNALVLTGDEGRDKLR